MSKKLFFILLCSIIFFVKADEEPDEMSNYDDDYYDGYGDNYFQESLKEYLVQNNLYDSDRIIQPDEMKKIFLEVITEGDAESSADYFGGIFNELSDFFVNEYYAKKKEIKGKDIFELFDINQISQKFEQMMEANPKYNGMNEVDEDDGDYDTRDDIGEPSPDV